MDLKNYYFGKDFACAMYEAGYLVREIAEALQLSLSGVDAWIRRAGVYTKNRRTKSPEERAEIARLYEDGSLPIRVIASRFGVNSSTINRVAQAAGVSRSKSEAQAARAAREGVTGDQRRGKKGAYQSIKAGRWIPADSAYELAFMEQMERNPSVASWSRCPDRIAYTFRGKTHSYVPDFRLTLASGAIEVIEVKPTKFLESDVNIAKFSAARENYEPTGVQFKVVTENDIGRACIDKAVARLAPEGGRKRRQLENQRRYIARLSGDQNSERLRLARERSAAFRAANRDAYNLAARKRRAQKRARNQSIGAS